MFNTAPPPPKQELNYNKLDHKAHFMSRANSYITKVGDGTLVSKHVGGGTWHEASFMIYFIVI